MISSDALITSSAIETTMIAMTCRGTRPPVSGGRLRGGGAELGGSISSAKDGNGSSRIVRGSRTKARDPETLKRVHAFSGSAVGIYSPCTARVPGIFCNGTGRLRRGFLRRTYLNRGYRHEGERISYRHGG